MSDFVDDNLALPAQRVDAGTPTGATNEAKAADFNFLLSAADSLRTHVEAHGTALDVVQGQLGATLDLTDSPNVAALGNIRFKRWSVSGTSPTLVTFSIDTERYLLFDCTLLAAGAEADLPSAVDRDGEVHTIKKLDASANVVTIAPQGGETIDGSSSATLSAQWAYVEVLSDGANWLIVGGGIGID